MAAGSFLQCSALYVFIWYHYDHDSQAKINCLGSTEVLSATLSRSHANHPISVLQTEYSPFCLDIEDPRVGVLETCRELGTAVVADSPMGRDLPTGPKTAKDVAKDSFLSAVPKFSEENFPKMLQLW